MSIDGFLESLAKDRGSLAFGVILSGTASDGTIGLRAIKAEGGKAVEAAKSQPQVHHNPPPTVALTTLGGTAIGFELLVWYDGQSCSRQEVLSALYFAISDALRAHDVKNAG